MTGILIKVAAVLATVLTVGFAILVAVHGPRHSRVVYHPAAASTINAAATPTPQATVTPGSAPSVPVAPGETTALFVGDSDTLGSRTAPGFPTATCRVLDWNCQVDAQAGTGYRASGDGSDAKARAYRARLSRDIKDYPDVSVVVVTGGRADLGVAGAAEAARDYYADLRKAYPAAKIVAVEPLWDSSNPPEAMVALQKDVHQAADAVHAIWISSDNWLEPDSVDTQEDAPTQQAQMWLSARMVLGLRAALS